jgi:hypothetical protein
MEPDLGLAQLGSWLRTLLHGVGYRRCCKIGHWYRVSNHA